MRYEVRKTNDVLHMFDTVEYKAVAAFPAIGRLTPCLRWLA